MVNVFRQKFPSWPLALYFTQEKKPCDTCRASFNRSLFEKALERFAKIQSKQFETELWKQYNEWKRNSPY